MSTEIVAKVQDLRKLEHQGECVITFSMMDELHGRPDGTARRNFSRHRAKLLENTDFFELRQAHEIRALGLQRKNGSTPDKPVLLTQTGYLMLVKSFRDELAWEVQRALVSHYFRSTEQLPSDHLNNAQMQGLMCAVLEGMASALQTGIAPLEEKTDRLETKVDDLAVRMDKLEKRRDLSAETKRQHIDTVAHFYNGKCPCCGEVEVVDEFHNKTEDGHWEHWFSPSKNRAHETWITCQSCNLKLRDDYEFRARHETAFKAYQMRREQKHYPLLQIHVEG